MKDRERIAAAIWDASWGHKDHKSWEDISREDTGMDRLDHRMALRQADAAIVEMDRIRGERG